MIALSQQKRARPRNDGERDRNEILRAAVTTAPMKLALQESGATAFETIARSCIRQMRANEACARPEQDPEGVHQFRIGLRKLRVLVGAYRQYLAPEFRDLL